MANQEAIPISSIKETTPRTEFIKVRVIRMWLRKSDKNPSVVQGVELILADQNGDTIQATIKKNLVKIFLEVLNEGDTYKIRKFNTSSNRLGYDMATYHQCKIWFEYSTKVIPAPIPDIPHTVHTFYTFKDFAMGAMPDKLYVDVIGQLEHVYPIKLNGDGTKRMTIVLGNYDFSAAEGVQNLFGVPENATHHPAILASANIKSLDEIQTLTQGGSYVTMATFVELATSGVSWFYNSCTECRAKVQMKDDGLWFQVKFIVTYEGSNLCEFIIWDDAMTELLGKTAQQILDEDDIFTLVPPPDFRPLIEKEFIVKIRVTKEFNIDQKSLSYGVICLSDDPTTISTWKNIHAASKEKSMSISSSSKDTNTDSMMEKLREMTEDEPAREVEELTPQKGIVVMVETPDKSSATKQQDIKMGKAPMDI
ncbi:uncharacterized protein LOC141620767 [Silene latifolia]|uniref:uncharacterized protein LOC141620767 n=1 Tax=Silene latifolia TaxID=37657 RepID=UPI003D7775CD